MKIRLGDIAESEQALGRLFSCRPKKAKDTFRLARIQREIRPILTDLQKARIDLLEKYSTGKDPEHPGRYRFVRMDEHGEPMLDENGKTILDSEAVNAYQAEQDELLDESVEVEQYITLAFIDRIGLEPGMTPTEMAMLWWLIEEFRSGENTDWED